MCSGADFFKDPLDDPLEDYNLVEGRSAFDDIHVEEDAGVGNRVTVSFDDRSCRVDAGL